MRRLFFVPQFPAVLRYQEFWYEEFPKKLSEKFDVIVLGKSYFNNYDTIMSKIRIQLRLEDFTPVTESLRFETCQILEFLKYEILDNDIIFVTDLSFQESFISQFYYRNVKNAFAFCHGTSKNKYDFFRKTKQSKWMAETAHSKLFKKIFVGSNYHKEKLGWNNIEVIGLPKNPYIVKYDVPKTQDIISVARDCVQKITRRIENKIKNEITEIIRKKVDTWEEYSKHLSASKILFISSKEDTFNYTLLDALTCDCIPVAPKRLCFIEILPDELLYENDNEACEIVNKILNNEITLPIRLKNQNLVDNFYNNLIYFLGG